jgi:hypothetical protein
VIIIKGSHVGFEMDEPAKKPVPHPSGNGKMIAGKIITLPSSYGIIQDPEGESFNRCEVFFGPFKITARRVKMTSAAKAYMGSSYPGRSAIVDVPKGSWNSLGTAVQIFYRRPGRYSGGYYHPFKKGLNLSKNGRFYRLSLENGCIVDDRGFVFP